MRGSHEVLLYASLREYLDVAVPFVEDGLRRHQPVWLFTGPVKAQAIRDALPARARRVFHPRLYGWAGVRAPMFAKLADHVVGQGGRAPDGLRILSEVKPGRHGEDLLTDLGVLEAAITAIAPEAGIDVLCAYDATRLAPGALDDALATHPQVGGHGKPSDRFVDPCSFVKVAWQRSLPAPAETPVEVVQARIHPAGARRSILLQTRAAGIPGERAHDVAWAVHEVTTNAVLYAHPPRMRFWREGDRLVWEIADRGSGINDPLAGYRPPDPRHRFGRGLWVARRLVDLLQIRSGRNGTVVRLQTLLPRSSSPMSPRQARKAALATG